MESNSVGREYKKPTDNHHLRETYRFVLAPDMLLLVEELGLREKISAAEALQRLVMNPEFIIAGIQFVEAKRKSNDRRVFQVTLSAHSQ